MFSLRAAARLTCRLHKFIVVDHVSQRNIKRWVRPTLVELTYRKKNQENPIDNPRNNWVEWNRSSEIYAFNVRLSEKFETNLLEQAFTHRSYIIKQEEEQKKIGIENPELNLVDNDEMISEGKQIASVIIENYLCQVLPLAPRECIYALKDYLLSTEILSKTSSGIGTKDLILTAEYPVTPETLANTFYALLSALNRSVNLEHTAIFIRDILISLLVEKDLLEIWCPTNPMKILNDILQTENREIAEPRITAQTGINTLIPVYQIAVYSSKEFLGIGFGDSIEEGTKLAALNALCRMFGLLDSSKPLRCNLDIDDNVRPNPFLEQWSRSNL